MLENILGSKSKVLILKCMFREPSKEFYLSDVSRCTRLSIGTVWPALKALSDSRMLNTKVAGNLRFYKVNDRNLFYPQLAELFSAERRGFVGLAKSFAASCPSRNIMNIILFGSSPRGDATARSDIDILLIVGKETEETKAQIRKLADDFLDKYDVEISPVYLTKQEVLSRKKKGDQFVINMLRDAIILRGDRRWLEKS